MQFFQNTHINFIGIRKIGYIISATLIVISLVSLVLHGGPRMGIDFTGGTSLDLAFAQSVSASELRNSLSDIGFGSAEIKQVGLKEANEFIIRVEKMEEGTEAGQVIEAELTQDFPNNTYEIKSVNEVGPKIGGELGRAAILAVLISLLGILIYISWRFEFKFAIGAVIALFHDVIITLGIFSLLNLEISLAVVAAFLTIVGYSINDTVVVFDRIRENLKVLRRETLPNIINKSLNQTISRTIITSLTTLIVVVVLFLLGGEVIHNFSLALIIGILIGTYSSIFIASPIVLEWQSRADEKKSRSTLLHKSR
ncbi:protein translocase subunit SecF [candidate division KSB1 bacterium]|nr:protein translocase subunit SecF [candidate division KSB1 bacterium]RQW03993.1 MAG: protein translocase subunit SecF [candidate division KSB1 bacterium]